MIQEVCFVDVDVWGPQAESSNQYLKKGSAVLIEGRLKFDSWQDTDGQKRSKHSIVADRVTFLSGAAQVSSEEVVDAANKLESIVEGNKKQKKASTNFSEDFDGQGEGSSSGEVAFKDEKPFEDDLPF